MDILKDKTYKSYNYTSRYASFPYYYNTVDKKYVYGLTNHLVEDIQTVIHNVDDTDTLDSLALKYYGRPDLFWVIADYNKIQDPYIVLYEHYNFLYIPALADIRFV